MTCTIRAYRPEDLESIVGLVNSAEAIDKLGDGTSVEEMRAELTAPNMIPEQNVFVAEEEDGRLVAYGVLRLFKETPESYFRTWFKVHPIRRGRGLEERMLRRLYDRAVERLAECNSPRVGLYSYANVLERDRLGAIERSGFHEVRRFWMMVRPTHADIPDLPVPQGLRFRPYRPEEDDARVLQAVNEAFRDHWGHTETTFEYWRHYVAQPSFAPSLSLVAEEEADGEIAGVCVITVNTEEIRRLNRKRGWIDILGVRRPYRRRGTGTALLAAGLRNLREARLHEAALGCDAENVTGATRIYERVGFQIEKTSLALRMGLRGEPAAEKGARTGATRPGSV